MENTREEEFPLLVLLVLFLVFFYLIVGKIRSGKTCSTSKSGRLFTYPRLYPPAHSLPPADNVHERSFSPRNWPLFAINLAIKAFSGKHVPEFTILYGYEGSGPIILAKKALKRPGF